jgi:hypothetical protein
MFGPSTRATCLGFRGRFFLTSEKEVFSSRANVYTELHESGQLFVVTEDSSPQDQGE